MLLGNFIAWPAGSLNYCLWYNIPIPPYLNIFVCAYALLIAYAIFKHNLMDIRIVFTRATVFFLVYIPVLGIPLWIGHRVCGEESYWYLPFATTVILATIGPFIYNKIRAMEKIEKQLLEKKKHKPNLDKDLIRPEYEISIENDHEVELKS